MSCFQIAVESSVWILIWMQNNSVYRIFIGLYLGCHILFLSCNIPTLPQAASLLRFPNHTHTYIPVGLLWMSDQLIAEAAADTIHNKYKRWTSMPSWGFERTIWAITLLRTCTLDCSVTKTGCIIHYCTNFSSVFNLIITFFFKLGSHFTVSYWWHMNEYECRSLVELFSEFRLLSESWLSNGCIKSSLYYISDCISLLDPVITLP